MAGAARAEPGRGPPSNRARHGGAAARLPAEPAHPVRHPGRPAARLRALREIESRWQGPTRASCPVCVEGLRQVAPASGYLTSSASWPACAPRAERRGARRAPGAPPAEAARHGWGPAAPPPPPPQRLVFAPADEPRTVLERKPLPLGARPTPAGPGGAARSLEKMWGRREGLPTAEPERPQGAALERSPSTDAGAVVCRARELGTGDARWAPRARGERRRHTITNGVDCDLLKQMKELEQEQEVLLQGLEMMARGREWYQQQLQRVQERQRRLGQSRASADFGAEGSPRLLGRLLPKVQEVARCLGDLLAAACAGREVTDKSERITQLEQEKSALIKQLFEARALSQQDAGPLDSTFI
nr:suppressor APC domain-containing protein 2 isoform X4 [Camelus dromedarius]